MNVYIVISNTWSQIMGAFAQISDAGAFLDQLIRSRQIRGGHVVELPLNQGMAYEPTHGRVVYRSGV